MKSFIIERVGLTPEATYGVLLLDGRPICLTLEDPWLDNERNISCIPSGVYYCVSFISTRFGKTYYVEDVPSRSGIIFHSGNWAGVPGVSKGKEAGDTQGCILPGSRFGRLRWRGGATGVLHSKKAFKGFLQAVDSDKEFQLTIR